MSERKEAKQAVEAQAEQVKQQEAARNAYATLMPLALPAPPPMTTGQQPDMSGANGYGGMPQPGYGGPTGGQAYGGYTGAGYAGSGYTGASY